MAQAPLAELPLTVERYFALVDQGVLRPDDHVELLEGVIVAMPPSGPRHAAIASAIYQRLAALVGERAALRPQFPLVAGTKSVPEPDLALVPGKQTDYLRKHPDRALLVIEVADSSLPQDRLTKAVIYAGAGIPEYWIVNLRDDVLEVLREPDRKLRLYSSWRTATRDESIRLVALPDVVVPVSAVLPPADAAD